MADIILAEREHPYFDDYIDRWDLYEAAVKGGKDFITEENLFSHRLEFTEDYEERLKRGFYLNFCETIPSIYNNFIFKEKVERPPDVELEPFRRDADGRGTSISDFIAKVGYLSKIFGAMHVLVDMPQKNEDITYTRRFVKENNISPYCNLIYPRMLKDWSRDSNQNFEWVVVEYNYFRDADPKKERDIEKYYKLITKKTWRCEDADGNLFVFEDGRDAEGTNDLGFVPLVTSYHKDIDDDRIGESMLKDIVFINRAIFNWSSCIDEMIERQTFSQLIVPDDGTLAEDSESGEDPLRKLGTANAWTFNANATHPPDFISPDTSNLQTVWKLIVDHIKEIYRLAGLIGTSEDMAASRSGKAAQMGFLGVNSALADTSRRYQQFENDLSRLSRLQMGKDSEVYKDVKYPDTFDIQSLTDEVDAYFTVMEKNFSETMNKEMMKKISRSALPMATPDIKTTIEEEIDAGDGYIQPNQTRAEVVGQETEHRAMAQQGGNPNLDQVKDSFRTKDRQVKEETSHRKKPDK